MLPINKWCLHDSQIKINCCTDGQRLIPLLHSVCMWDALLGESSVSCVDNLICTWGSTFVDLFCLQNRSNTVLNPCIWHSGRVDILQTRNNLRGGAKRQKGHFLKITINWNTLWKGWSCKIKIMAKSMNLQNLGSHLPITKQPRPEACHPLSSILL